jgi:hypothetical protein
MRNNWGAPFIVAFIILLIVTAGCNSARSHGLGLIAIDLAVYAYYALMVGVLLQIVSYLRYREKD